MVFQNGALFDSLNVRENVAFPLRERGGLAEDQVVQIVDRLISMVGADDDVTEKFAGQPFPARAQACGGHCTRIGRSA